MVAAAAAVDSRNAVTGQLEVRSRLGPSRNPDRNRSVDGVDGQFRPQSCFDHVDRLGAQDEIALAGEVLVGLDPQLDQQILRLALGVGFALAGQPDNHPVFNPGRDVDFNLLFLGRNAPAIAALAGFRDQIARASTN